MPPLVAQASRGVFHDRSAKREGGDSVKADKHSSSHTYKEVTMVKRIAALAIVLAAFLIVAVPAFAANGARADYTTSEYCSICHKVGQAGGAPKVYNAWSQTAHGTDAEAVNAAKGLPTGSVCAGCHTANFAPGKVIPTPTATTWLPAPSSA